MTFSADHRRRRSASRISQGSDTPADVERDDGQVVADTDFDIRSEPDSDAIGLSEMTAEVGLSDIIKVPPRTPNVVRKIADAGNIKQKGRFARCSI
jgi:hypothetical protein